MQHSTFYDWGRHFKPFGLDGAEKPGEEEGDINNESVNNFYIVT